MQSGGAQASPAALAPSSSHHPDRLRYTVQGTEAPQGRAPPHPAPPPAAGATPATAPPSPAPRRLPGVLLAAPSVTATCTPRSLRPHRTCWNYLLPPARGQAKCRRPGRAPSGGQGRPWTRPRALGSSGVSGQSQTQRNSICQVIDLPGNCFTKFLFLFYLGNFTCFCHKIVRQPWRIFQSPAAARGRGPQPHLPLSSRQLGCSPGLLRCRCGHSPGASEGDGPPNQSSGSWTQHKHVLQPDGQCARGWVI